MTNKCVDRYRSSLKQIFCLLIWFDIAPYKTCQLSPFILTCLGGLQIHVGKILCCKLTIRTLTQRNHFMGSMWYLGHRPGITWDNLCSPVCKADHYSLKSLYNTITFKDTLILNWWTGKQKTRFLLKPQTSLEPTYLLSPERVTIMDLIVDRYAADAWCEMWRSYPDLGSHVYLSVIAIIKALDISSDNWTDLPKLTTFPFHVLCVSHSAGFNVYSCLKHRTLVLTIDAADFLEHRLLYLFNRFEQDRLKKHQINQKIIYGQMGLDPLKNKYDWRPNQWEEYISCVRSIERQIWLKITPPAENYILESGFLRVTVCVDCSICQLPCTYYAWLYFSSLSQERIEEDVWYGLITVTRFLTSWKRRD